MIFLHIYQREIFPNESWRQVLTQYWVSCHVKAKSSGRKEKWGPAWGRQTAVSDAVTALLSLLGIRGFLLFLGGLWVFLLHTIHLCWSSLHNVHSWLKTSHWFELCVPQSLFFTILVTEWTDEQSLSQTEKVSDKPLNERLNFICLQWWESLLNLPVFSPQK